MTENFAQINIRHQTTDPRNSENTKHGKCPKTNKNQTTKKQFTTLWHIILKLQKIKYNEKSQKGILTYRGSKTVITYDTPSETCM